MGIGKLYRLGDNQFISRINYQLFQHEAASKWWGELTLSDYASLDEGDVFVIELEDKRKSQCLVKKMVNRVVHGIPPRYTYHVTGIGLIE